MALTKPFHALVRARMKRDAAFREGLLSDGIAALVRGETETAKAVLRHYIHATGGFARLGRATGIPPKSLHRMLGPRGNPTMRHVGALLAHFTRRRKLTVRVAPRR
ncbi:MAG: helix-turn-helix domain-containing transcriptional regulator [Rhodospirillales bacterium]